MSRLFLIWGHLLDLWQRLGRSNTPRPRGVAEVIMSERSSLAWEGGEEGGTWFDAWCPVEAFDGFRDSLDLLLALLVVQVFDFPLRHRVLFEFSALVSFEATSKRLARRTWRIS
jgi:hypothetical protein